MLVFRFRLEFWADGRRRLPVIPESDPKGRELRAFHVSPWAEIACQGSRQT